MKKDIILSTPDFNLIPQFTREADYSIRVPWKHLFQWIDDIKIYTPVHLNPAFQRIHVWDEARQRKYIEFVLRGGKSSRDIYWNCKNWMRLSTDKTQYPLVLVDGKQRIKAVEQFMNNELTVFNNLFYKDFINKLPIDVSFTMHINDLESNIEVMEWYIDINSGGIAHTDEEIKKVEELILLEETSS